jgi:hypothetical protein
MPYCGLNPSRMPFSPSPINYRFIFVVRHPIQHNKQCSIFDTSDYRSNPQTLVGETSRISDGRRLFTSRFASGLGFDAILFEAAIGGGSLAASFDQDMSLSLR